MQVNKIGNTNFGANPCAITKSVLVAMEQRGIDTTGIIEKMLAIVPRGSIKTHRFSDGVCRMDVFSATGICSKSIINTSDALHLDVNFVPLQPERLYAKLNKGLDWILAKRTPDEKICDKIERQCIRG